LRDLGSLVGVSCSLNAVHEPVVPGDAAGPPAGQDALQRFRLA